LVVSCSVSQHVCETEQETTNHLPYVEMIGRFLLGLADMLRFIAERLQEFGRHLIELALLPQPIEGGAQ